MIFVILIPVQLAKLKKFLNKVNEFFLLYINNTVILLILL